METFACIIVFLLIGGLSYTWYAVGAGITYIFGRALFHIGYATKGPSGRLAGLGIMSISTLMLMVLSVLSPLKLKGVY